MIDKTGLGSSAFRFGLPALGRFSQRVQRRKRACPLAMYYMPPCSQRVQRRKRAHGPLQDSLGSLAFGFGRASEGFQRRRLVPSSVPSSSSASVVDFSSLFAAFESCR